MAKRNLIPENWFNMDLEDRSKSSNILTQLQREFEGILYKPFQITNFLRKYEGFLLQMDSSEDNNSYPVSIEAPGLGPKDIEISVLIEAKFHNGILNITLSKSEAKQKATKKIEIHPVQISVKLLEESYKCLFSKPEIICHDR